VAYKLTEKWTVSTGVRNDLRKDNSPVVPLSRYGGAHGRSRAVKFDSQRLLSAYGSASARSRKRRREENDRIGVGGSYRLTNASGLTGGVDGHLDPVEKSGTSFLDSRGPVIT